MYNHLLIVSDGKKNYEAIVESAPIKEETIIEKINPMPNINIKEQIVRFRRVHASCAYFFIAI